MKSLYQWVKSGNYKYIISNESCILNKNNLIYSLDVALTLEESNSSITIEYSERNNKLNTKKEEANYMHE